MSNSKRKSLQLQQQGQAQLERETTKGQDSSLIDDNHDLEDANLSEDEEGGYRVGGIYIPPPVEAHCSTESKGKRLIIKRIENENFKSYAGKVTLGPFHHCFTAIIGPNGSGKSNVIDSMLFVFGYRAQKIRCKKLSVLLHNSARFPNVQSCSVAVHFKEIIDKPDGSCQEVDGSELIIARHAHRDNSSYYTVNGKRVQFKEVSKLLKQHGVDLDHNRFLILQGEVESIAMMKAKGQAENECGMLEYLEDIVGTTRYKEPLQKINERVEALTETRTDHHNRCKIAERDMKELEEPYLEAIDYLKLENAQARTKNLLIQKHISEEQKKLTEHTSEREGICGELKEHDDKYNAIKEERLAKEETIREEVAKYEKMVKEKDEMEQKLKASLKNFTEVQATMQATNKRRKANKTQLEKLGEKLIELKKVPEQNQNEIEECERKVEQLTKQKSNFEEQLQKNYAELEAETRPLIEQREGLETGLIDVTKVVDEAKAELALAESELGILKSDETTAKRKYESLKTSLMDSKASLTEKTSTVKDLQAEIGQIKTGITAKVKQLEEYRKEEETLTGKVRSIRGEINEKVNSMQATKSSNKVLNSLMRQKDEGRIPGILGRLGDLGAIDAKYDVAISTACGRLDNIIVDTVNTAQECIEHLKRHDVGRASFIALEKVSHLQRQSQQRIQTPENAARLFDLVRVEDERVLPAFYFALRNTLVATDLEQGTRIAYGAQRFRVVTLQGDLIEISGTMSGGGRTQIRGKMGQKVATKTNVSANTSTISQKHLEDLQVQAEEMQSRINYCQEEQGRLEHEINSNRNELKQKESELSKLTVNINSLAEALPRLEAQLKDQKEKMDNTTADKKKVQALEKKIAEKQKTFESAEANAKEVKDEIEEINKKIAAIHGNKVKSVQTKIASLTKQINTLNNNVSKLRVEVTTSERNYQKTEKQIEDLKTDIANAETEIKKLNEEREKHDLEGVEWQKKVEEAKEAIEKASKGSSEVQKEIIALQKQESDGKLKRVEIEEKLKAIDAKIRDIKNALPHWQNKLKPLKLQVIPGETEPLEPLKTYTEEELSTHKLQDVHQLHSSQEEKLAGKKPNLTCIEEYTNKREVYLDRVKKLEDITSKRNEMRQLYDDVRKKRYTEFMQGFYIITKKLKEMYQMITQGGDAELELVDSMDPFTEGVSFSVRPPKKTWKNISNLSGGEKTLSSLALVFALHYYKPSPLYFMDEIDAALDFKNISIVAHYIKERTKNAQFIIISLRSNMFELCDYIVGIYKVRDCTNSVTIKNKAPETPPMPSSQAPTRPTISSSQVLSASTSTSFNSVIPSSTRIHDMTAGGSSQQPPPPSESDQGIAMETNSSITSSSNESVVPMFPPPATPPSTPTPQSATPPDTPQSDAVDIVEGQ